MISVTILTKNSAKYLRDVLSSVQSFDEVLVYDTGSTDETFSIAQQFPNVRVIKTEFSGFGPTHNQASNQAKHNWVLSIDSDEVLTKELEQEIRNLNLNDSHVYSFPRHNYYNNKFIKWCGWYPDRQFRLYNKTKTSFTNDHVHEKIITENLTHIPLKSPIKHYSYGSTADFLAKMQSYSDLFAKQNCGRKNSSLTHAIFHGGFAFFKSYFLKRGILGGKEGFEISFYNANTAFYKYLKLHYANEKSKELKK